MGIYRNRDCFGLIALIFGWRQHGSMRVLGLLVGGIVLLFVSRGLEVGLGHGDHHDDHHDAHVAEAHDATAHDAHGHQEDEAHHGGKHGHDDTHGHEDTHGHDEQQAHYDAHGPFADPAHLAGTIIGVFAGFMLLLGHLLNIRAARRSREQCCDTDVTSPYLSNVWSLTPAVRSVDVHGCPCAWRAGRAYIYLSQYYCNKGICAVHGWLREFRRMNNIPVTVLAGTGRTHGHRILETILANAPGHRIAAIVPKRRSRKTTVGERLFQTRPRTVQVGNGCSYCFVRDDIMTKVRRITTEQSADHIVIVEEPGSDLETLAKRLLLQMILGRCSLT